jgi:hypothetical protein
MLYSVFQAGILESMVFFLILAIMLLYYPPATANMACPVISDASSQMKSHIMAALSHVFITSITSLLPITVSMTASPLVTALTVCVPILGPITPELGSTRYLAMTGQVKSAIGAQVLREGRDDIQGVFKVAMRVERSIRQFSLLCHA